MARAAAVLHGAHVDVDIEGGYPPVVNTPPEARIARSAASAALGDDAVVAMEHPSMGAEDFAYYLYEVPGCFVRFGARKAGGEYIPLHSPAFDIDEQVLQVGAAFFDEVARRAIHEYQR